MELTRLGQALRDPVRDIVVRSQATLAAKAPAVEQSRFVFHVSDYAATVLLAPLTRQLESEAPGLSIRMISLGNSNMQRLERGDIDFAIYPSLNASADHPQETLLQETQTYSCVVRNEITADNLNFDAYMKARHVAVEFGDQRVPTFERWFLSTHGVARHVVVTANTFAGVPPLVIGTQRIATMHTRLARLYEGMPPIRLVPPPFDIPPLELVMQWNRHNDKDAAPTLAQAAP